MRKYLLIILGCTYFWHSNCFSQVRENEKTEYYKMQSNDVFLVNLNIKKIYSKEFNLGTFFHPKRYNLCSIEIDSILFSYDTLHILKDQPLSNKYLLFRKGVILKQDSSYCISFCQTSYPNVFLFGRVIPLEVQKSRNYHYHAIISSYGIESEKLKKFLTKCNNADF